MTISAKNPVAAASAAHLSKPSVAPKTVPAPSALELMQDLVVVNALQAAWSLSMMSHFDGSPGFEYGGWIYANLQKLVATSQPMRGYVSNMGTLLDKPVLLPHYYVVATYHTHPSTAYGASLEPGPADTGSAVRRGVPSLIVGNATGVRYLSGFPLQYIYTGPLSRDGGLSGRPGFPHLLIVEGE